MNLEEIGAFKERIVSRFIRDPNIIDVLLGDVSGIDDVESALLGKNGSGENGRIFKYEYVPDIQEQSKTFLCIEVVPIQTYGDSVTEFNLYVFAYCSKNVVQTYRRKGCSGTRVDILISDVDKILNGSTEFGIGPLEWTCGDIYKPAISYYGRMSMYSVSSFRRWRHKDGSYED